MSHEPVLPLATEYLFRKATAAGIPLSGTFELTPVCNMDCKMCYIRLSRQQQEAISPLHSAEEWLDLATRAKECGMLYLLLTGGEPFLHPEFRQILTGLHQMGLIININSNGTLITEETIRWLMEVPPSRINISLYGASNDTYHRLCGNPNGFTQTDETIQRLKKAGIPVKLNCSLTPHNCSDLPQIINYATSNDLIVQTTTYMFPPLRKEDTPFEPSNRFTPEEAAYYTVYTDLLTYGKEAFLARPDHPVNVSAPDDGCTGIGEPSKCRAGKSSFWVTWKGDMLPCGMFPATTDTNVFRQSFTDVWEHIKRTTSQIRLPVKCATCTIKNNCRTCAAMVITECGRFDIAPQYRCTMTESLSAQQAFLKQKIMEDSI